MYKILNEDCRDTLKRLKDKSISGILTSPFYNTCRSTNYNKTQKSRDNYEGRYDVHLDDLTNDEEIEVT